MPKKESEDQEAHSYEYVVVGHVLSQWGTNGELEVELMTDFPDRFEPQREVYFNGLPLTIEKSRPHKGHVIIKFKGIDNIESAIKLRGNDLEIPLIETHTLPEGEYYRFQIIGLEVFNTDGEPVGKITDVLPTGSNDVYLAQSPQGEVLIPAIEDVIKSIDIENGRMIIQIIDGLI